MWVCRDAKFCVSMHGRASLRCSGNQKLRSRKIKRKQWVDRTVTGRIGNSVKTPPPHSPQVAVADAGRVCAD